MDEARKEQTKLTATYLNGVAVATFAVGALSPIFTSLISRSDTSLNTVLGGSVVCVLASLALHLGGRRWLKELRS